MFAKLLVILCCLMFYMECLALTFNNIHGDDGDYSAGSSFATLNDNDIEGNTTNGWSFHSATVTGDSNMTLVKIVNGAGGTKVYTATSNPLNFNFVVFTLTVSGELVKPGEGEGSLPGYTLTGNRPGEFFVEPKEIIVAEGQGGTFTAKEKLPTGFSQQKYCNWTISPNPYTADGVLTTVSDISNKTVVDIGGVSSWPAPDPGIYTITANAVPVTNPGNVAKGTATLKVVGIDISINNTKLTLKHSNQATITILTKPNSVALTDYTIEIARKGLLSNWYTLSSGSVSYSWTAKIAGEFQLRAKAKVNGMEVVSKIIDVAVQFPSFNEIIEDKVVKSKMDSEWQNTLNDCTPNPNRCRERGFWIILDTTDNSYKISEIFLGPWNEPPDTASIDLGKRPGVRLSVPAPNANGATYAVASFHTHPPMTYFPYESGRRTGPSSADMNKDMADNVAGIVYDYTTAFITGGHPEGATAVPKMSRSRRDLNQE